MAYSEALADRVRQELKGVKALSEKRMMGGLCLLVEGNMLAAVGRASDGGDRLMLRVGKENESQSLLRPGATAVEMGGRRMGGFVHVEAAALDKAGLKDWLALALDFVATLPRK